MTDAEQIKQAIVENATGPKRASNDSTSAEQHPLTEQMDAAQFVAGVNAVKKPSVGMTFRKLVPPGAV